MQWYNDYVMAKKNSAEEREKRKKLKDASKSAVVSKPAENRPNADVAASGSASNESPLKPSNIEVKAEVKLPVVSNIVLKPERFSPTATVQNSSPRNSVNVRDFENLGEDPFDNLELKTIDDMEELKSVLVFSDSGKYGAVAAETHRSEDVNTSSQNPFENVQTNSTAQSSCADNKHFDAIAAGNEAEQKDESIYANAETIGPRVQKQRSSEVGSEGNSALKSHKLPMPSPRLSLNSDIILSEDPTTAADRQSSSYVSETAEVLSNQTPTSADTADIKEHSEQEKPVVKAKPPVKEKPVVKEKPTIKAKPPMKGKAINRELPAKESATRESRTAHLSSMIEQLELNKDTSVARYTPKGFSYFQPSAAHSETVKEIEWPSLERCESRDNDTAESTGTRSGKLPISPNSITRNPLSRSDQVKRNHLDHNLDLQNIPCQPATHLPSLANGSAAPMAEATKQMKRKPARPPPPVPETNRKSGPSKPAPASGQSAVASDNEVRGIPYYIHLPPSFSIQSLLVHAIIVPADISGFYAIQDTDQVVTSLLAMGFTKSLVDSAVKKYGVDTKKVGPSCTT